jgi:hypothetical protein
MAVTLIILLGLVARAHLAQGPRAAPTSPQGRARANEHAATHHAIWLPVVQELGLAMRADIVGRGTRLRMTGTRRAVALTIDVHIPWLFSASVWRTLAEGGGFVAESGDWLEALEALRLEIHVPVSAPMPAGLRVSLESGSSHALHYIGIHDVPTGDPALDDKVRVLGDDRDAVQALVTDPRVRTALARVARLDLPFIWSPEGVRLTAQPHRIHQFRPGQLKEHADASAGLAAAAIARQWAPWARLGGSLGLSREGDRLIGTLSGVQVQIETRFDQGVATIDVGKALRPLRLAASDPGGPGDSIKFPNPVLAAALSGRTRDKFLARRVLSDEVSATALVEVLRGTEGASLVDGTFRLPICPDSDAADAIRAAVVLSRRLLRIAR